MMQHSFTNEAVISKFNLITCAFSAFLYSSCLRVCGLLSLPMSGDWPYTTLIFKQKLLLRTPSHSVNLKYGSRLSGTPNTAVCIAERTGNDPFLSNLYCASHNSHSADEAENHNVLLFTYSSNKS